MSITVSNSSLIQTNTNFKGKYKKTKNGNQYYSTNSAAITGGVVTVPVVLYALSKSNNRPNNIKLGIETSLKLLTNFDSGAFEYMRKFFNYDELRNVLESISKESKANKWLNVILTSFLTLGSGLIVNGIRNKKARKTADMIAEKGTDETLKENKNIKISKSGNPYYKSNDGKKYGALLGLGTGTIIIGTNYLMNKNLLNNIFKAGKNSIIKLAKEYNLEAVSEKVINKFLRKGGLITLTAALSCFAAGGIIIGAIADGAANKKARKNA